MCAGTSLCVVSSLRASSFRVSRAKLSVKHYGYRCTYGKSAMSVSLSCLSLSTVCLTCLLLFLFTENGLTDLESIDFHLERRRERKQKLLVPSRLFPSQSILSASAPSFVSAFLEKKTITTTTTTTTGRCSRSLLPQGTESVGDGGCSSCARERERASAIAPSSTSSSLTTQPPPSIRLVSSLCVACPSMHPCKQETQGTEVSPSSTHTHTYFSRHDPLTLLRMSFSFEDPTLLSLAISTYTCRGVCVPDRSKQSC